jgi:predicted nucleotidyltransferase
MEKRILEKLKEIEAQKGIEILFAVESGSRAWGFTSPDSDYDIRFVFKRPTEDYLDLWEKKDTIEFMTEDDLDGSGWDLKKATLLLAKSNASFLGWLFSPIVYINKGSCLEDMRKLAKENFNPVAGFYHYHSMNKGFQEQLENEDLKLKPFFYAIRTALCANWILKQHTIPPVLFTEFYPFLDPKDCELLDELIAIKAEQKELAEYKVNKRLIELAKEIVQENNDGKDNLPTFKPNLVAFNQFFKNQLMH